jgi:hypothetical protein
MDDPYNSHIGGSRNSMISHKSMDAGKKILINGGYAALNSETGAST